MEDGSRDNDNSHTPVSVKSFQLRSAVVSILNDSKHFLGKRKRKLTTRRSATSAAESACRVGNLRLPTHASAAGLPTRQAVLHMYQAHESLCMFASFNAVYLSRRLSAFLTRLDLNLL